MKNRKNRLCVALFALLLAASLLAMSSCGILLETDEEEYLTKSEVEELLNGRLDGNVTVEGGDNYDITINNTGNQNVTTASKAMLSAVAVRSYFKKNYASGFGPNASISTREYALSGSGVIYKLDKENGDAYIITNYHVVYDSSSNTANKISGDIDVFLYGMENTDLKIDATYIGGSAAFDIAVLKVEDSRLLVESNAVAAVVADSNLVTALDTAIAIGAPDALGLDASNVTDIHLLPVDNISATLGYVSVDSEYITTSYLDLYSSIDMRLIRIDTAVNSGNSGGGLFNDRGELIGIVNAKMADTSIDNISYAIPSNIAKYVTDNIIYNCDGKEGENLLKPIIGITVASSDPRTVLDEESGRIYKEETVSVSKITAGSVAEALFEVGDVLNSVTIDGVKYEITRQFHLIDCMLNARVGSEVIISVTRVVDGEETKLDKTVEITEDILVKYP